MGLFDIMSKSYFKDKRENERNVAGRAEYKRLLDAARTPSATTYGSLMQPQTETFNSRTGATEITGGEQMQGAGTQVGGMMDPQTRRQFNTDIGAIHGYGDMSTNLQMQDARGDQAMQRQQQEQQFYKGNMTAYQQAQMRHQKAQLLSTQGNQNFDQMVKLQSSYDTEIEPYEVSVGNAKAVDNMVQQMGYEDAASQQFIVSKALSTIRPGEAQMEGDIRALARASGFKGEIKDAWSYLTTTAAKDPGILKGLHAMIQKQATLDQQNINATRNKIKKAYGLNDPAMKVITWGDATSEDQYAAPTAASMGLEGATWR